MARKAGVSRWWRPQGPRFAAALLVFIVAGGTLGYMAVEGWSAWDAFYMTVITVTTVGYREVHDLSRAGQAFTVVLLFVGVGGALYTFTMMASAVVEGGLPKRLRRHRREHMLDTIKDHFIVCGYGRIGRLIASQFRHQSIPFVVIEMDPGRTQMAVDDGVLAIEGEASREEVLTRAGIGSARGLIAAVGTDAENVYTVLSARVLNPDLFIIARAGAEDSEQKLLRAGANRVVSPYHIGAMQIAQTAIRPAVVDFVDLATNAENLELSMEEIAVAAGSSLANQTVLDANLRQRFGVIVIGIQRRDRHMDFNPEPVTIIGPGDKLVVLGRSESLKRLEVEAKS
jgi:voltage-gated potassium channel